MVQALLQMIDCIEAVHEIIIGKPFVKDIRRRNIFGCHISQQKFARALVEFHQKIPVYGTPSRMVVEIAHEAVPKIRQPVFLTKRLPGGVFLLKTVTGGRKGA